jgi:hypothetical protein
VIVVVNVIDAERKNIAYTYGKQRASYRRRNSRFFLNEACVHKRKVGRVDLDLAGALAVSSGNRVGMRFVSPADVVEGDAAPPTACKAARRGH